MNKFILFLLLFLSVNCYSYAYVASDDFVDSTLKNKNIEKPQAHIKYDYTDTFRLPLRLKIIEEITSEADIYEGQQISFEVSSNVYLDGKLIIEKGTIVPARIETIIKSGMNGIPASIIIGNFQFENIDKGKITEFYEVKGQDRSLWVFPLKWALTPLPPTGSLTNFIKGGHAKLDTHDTIEIYYYPNWI